MDFNHREITPVRLLLVLVLLAASHLSAAQSIQLDWVKTVDHSFGNKLAIDSNKAILVLGGFSGTVDFDPGPGVFNMTAASNQDLYIAKFDSSGHFEWAKQITSPNGLVGSAIKIDRNGDLLILGSFNGSADFDPGPGTAFLTSTYENSFLLRWDHEGNFIWVKDLPNLLNTMDTDPSGNIILGGSFAGTVDFDPGPGTYLASTGGDNTVDLALLKLDNTGNFIWMKQIDNLGSAQVVQTWGLRTDPEGNILFAGNFTSTMDFDPGPAMAVLTSRGADDAFILKLDAQGNFKWVSQFGAAGSDKALGLEVDKNGNVYSTGMFLGSVDFDPGSGVYLLNGGTQYSAFVSKLDKNGNFVYAKSFQGGQSFGQALAIDSSNNLYISGYCSGPTDLDPGPGQFIANSFNLYTVKLDENGNFVWAAPYPLVSGPGISSVYIDIKVDIMKNVYFTGIFSGTVDFDPTAGTYLVTDTTTYPGADTYIHKLSQCHNTLSLISAESCDTFSLNGVSYSSPGLYYQTLTNGVGCDSIIQLTLSRKEVYGKSAATSCGSYLWNGKVLTASGVYRDTFPSAMACDSVAELDLTLTNKLVFLADTVCGVYSWNGAQLTNSGTYTDSIRLASGCDSIVSLSLVVLPNPTPFLGKDTVLCKGDTITLSPGSFETYTWSDHSTASAFLVKDTGTYWVQVTAANQCQGSDSIRITRSGQCSCSLGHGTRIYPAPFADYLYIDKEHTSCQVMLNLFDMLGQLVKKDIILTDGVNRISLFDLAPGMYVYKLHSDGKTLLTGKALKLQ